MKPLIVLLVMLLSASTARSEGRALTLHLSSGNVRYEVTTRTLGIGGDDVSAVNRAVSGTIYVTEEGRIEGGLIVPVVAFDSNNSRRDRDVANILKYKEYPAITVEVAGLTGEAIRRVAESDSGRVDVRAKITAAGGSKVYEAVLEFHAQGRNAIRFTTRIEAKFSDFGIEPPRLGLILKTAPDRILLSGDLVFDVTKEGKDRP